MPTMKKIRKTPKPKLREPTLVGKHYPYLSMREIADNLNLIAGGNATWTATKMRRHLERRPGAVFQLQPAVPRRGKGTGVVRQQSEVTRSVWVTTLEKLNEHYPELFREIYKHLSRPEQARAAKALGGSFDDDHDDAGG